MKKLVFTSLLFFTFLGFTQVKEYNTLLSKHVSEIGFVNYQGIMKDSLLLNKYMDYLQSNHPDANWNTNKSKAFWINAYNAYTLKAILDHLPLSSIKDIKYGDKTIWDHPFVIIGGKTYTLNHIEHEILRKDYNDPRIHAGVNCASFSCPALPSTAFTEQTVDQMLDMYMKKFVNDKNRNIIRPNEILISEIFNWFKDDFTKSGTVLDYLNKYSETKISPNTKITFLNYNWNLNGK